MVEANKKLVRILGKMLCEKRTKLGKSIYQISAESSIDNSTWRKIEAGKYNDLKLSTIFKIAEGLNILPEKLIEELRLNIGDRIFTED